MENKTCSSCNQSKPTTEFNKRAKNRDGLDGFCKPCRRSAKSEWRIKYNAENGEPESARYNRSHLEQYAKLKHQRVQRNLMIVLRRKWFPCKDCDKTFPPVCMDFDHVKGTKVDSISRMIHGAVSVKRLLEELDKCELVCANCHRIRTYNRNRPWEEEIRKYDRSTWWIPTDVDFTPEELLMLESAPVS